MVIEDLAKDMVLGKIEGGDYLRMKILECLNISIFQYRNVPTSQYSDVPISQCSDIPMFKRLDIQMFKIEPLFTLPTKTDYSAP